MPTLRSISIGKETRLIASTAAASTKPTPQPMTIIAQPAGVKNTSPRKAATDSAGSGPSVSRQIQCAMTSQATKSDRR